MDPWAPINGISLERYAELAAEVAETSHPAKQTEIVAQKGVRPVDWQAAKAGWAARMQDVVLGGQVAARFSSLYQAAVARQKGGAPAVPPADSSTHAVSGAMPGAVPPPGYGVPAAQPAYAHPPAYPPAPGYAQPQPGYPQGGYNQQAVAFGNQVGSALNAFGNALGSFVNSAVAPFAPGAPVLVQWSDGHRYPATVMLVHSGQVQVAFPDGRQVWVPQPYVTPR